jgi:hypothetical protein
MVQVAEELIKAVHGRQRFVAIADVAPDDQNVRLLAVRLGRRLLRLRRVNRGS